MKYFVVANKWDDERKACVKHIAGQFEDYTNASLFRKAYNAYYSTESIIIKEFELLNA